MDLFTGYCLFTQTDGGRQGGGGVLFLNPLFIAGVYLLCMFIYQVQQKIKLRVAKPLRYFLDLLIVAGLPYWLTTKTNFDVEHIKIGAEIPVWLAIILFIDSVCSVVVLRAVLWEVEGRDLLNFGRWRRRAMSD